jgi:crotonobetainyl-CoA:carnitine CoA-transferase CaiB-like acyl-CoA transferase
MVSVAPQSPPDGDSGKTMPSSSPLTGVRVVDMTTSYAGPTAAMYLADLGADVIKVERPPRGDDARGWGPPFVGDMSVWFASANRNKRSLALDLKSEAGREVLERLLGSAQIFLHNVNPAKLERLRITPEEIRRRHPYLVYCSLSGFGLSGPDAHLPGYDLVAQARSGMMSVTGASGGVPQRVSTALSDVATAMATVSAVLAALRRLEHTGRGETVEVSLLDTDLALMAPRIASYLAGEPEPAPSGGTDSVIAVYQAFDTADDQRIVVAIGNDAIWQRFCLCAAMSDLAGDARLLTNAGRREHQAEILARIAGELATDTAANWLRRLTDAGVPAASVLRLSQVVQDQHVAARESILAIQSGDGEVYGIRSPWRFESDDPQVVSAPPRFSQHSADVLKELGYTDSEIVALLET